MEGSIRDSMKTDEGGCEKSGGGKQICQGKIRVWRLGGLWAGIGLLSRNSQNILILQIKFGNLFLKTETTVSVKNICPTLLEK